MTAPSAAGIADAAQRLARYARPTPLVRPLLLADDLGCDLWIKNETVSPIASFKWRGALTELLRVSSQTGRGIPRQNEHVASASGSLAELGMTQGVVTSSTGNHGQGVAWAAAVLGIPAHVFLPEHANPTKRTKIALLGATIHETGHDLDAAKETAIAFASREGFPFIDDGESLGVIEGAGTIGLEIDLPRVDVVFVPMGSGSLASGVALAIKSRHPRARVIAVQSSGSPAMVESFRARTAVERPAQTIADGLVCRVPAQLALATLLECVDGALLVSDAELKAATRRMMTRAHLLVEPSGAAGLAAALTMREELAGKSVVLIATGANITEELLVEVTRG